MPEEQHRARKRFGQNFLHDQAVIQNIINAINPEADDHFIEIGPGQGALTGPLLKIVPHLDVIEIDRDLVRLLDEKFNQVKKQLTLHEQDALTFDFSSFNRHDLRIVGNLPYNISTPLLFHLLDQANTIRDMTFMLQKEVVDRMSAEPGSKKYGRLSVMLQTRCVVRSLFVVKPGAFRPVPRVDSAIVQLLPHNRYLEQIRNPLLFSTLVKDAFAQRRKTLRNTLKHHFNDSELKALNIDPTARAEKLGIKDYIELANLADARQNTLS